MEAAQLYFHFPRLRLEKKLSIAEKNIYFIELTKYGLG